MIQPKLLAHALIHAQFDLNATLLPPPGCKIAIHDRRDNRRTWTEHAIPEDTMLAPTYSTAGIMNATSLKPSVPESPTE